MKIFLLLILFVAVLEADLYGQQDPLYAQYFNNPMLINPAFAGSNDRLIGSLAYRSQWSGLEGAPATFNFNSHISLAQNKIGAGVILLQDKLGEFRTTQIGGVFSYRISLEKADLSFGMQAGLEHHATNLEDVRVQYADPLFTPFSTMKFNTGVGLLLKNDRYLIGLSVPRLLANTVQQGGEDVRIYKQNYYAYGGYLFFITERIEFKPSTLLRFTQGTPISADLNFNVTFNRLYTGGIFTRNLNNYGILLQFVLNSMRLSYVFELPGGSSELNYSTHELGFSVSLSALPSHDSNSGF